MSSEGVDIESVGMIIMHEQILKTIVVLNTVMQDR